VNTQETTGDCASTNGLNLNYILSGADLLFPIITPLSFPYNTPRLVLRYDEDVRPTAKGERV
jgi:hypothetical protein